MARRRGKGLSLKLEGVKVTVNELVKWDRGLKIRLKRETIKEAREALNKARAHNFQNRSWSLHRSIAMQFFRDSFTAVVGAFGVKYASYVNWGFQRRFNFLDNKKLKLKYRRNIRRKIRSLMRR